MKFENIFARTRSRCRRCLRGTGRLVVLFFVPCPRRSTYIRFVGSFVSNKIERRRSYFSSTRRFCTVRRFVGAIRVFVFNYWPTADSCVRQMRSCATKKKKATGRFSFGRKLLMGEGGEVTYSRITEFTKNCTVVLATESVVYDLEQVTRLFICVGSPNKT